MNNKKDFKSPFYVSVVCLWLITAVTFGFLTIVAGIYYSQISNIEATMVKSCDAGNEDIKKFSQSAAVLLIMFGATTGINLFIFFVHYIVWREIDKIDKNDVVTNTKV